MTGTELILPNGTTMAVRDRRAVTVSERRDPRGATHRIGWTSPDMPQVDEWDATAAYKLGYLANVIAYRGVQIRANAAAKVPLVAGTRLGDATSIREGAPIARLLGPPPGGPAPKLSARKLIRWTFAQEIVTGRRAWEIETDDGSADGRPVAFWPLVVAQLKAVPSKSGTEWFRVFEYGQHPQTVRFQPGQVFYGWDPSGTDFRQAESPLQAARFDLTLVNLCDRHGIGFLRNNAVPAAIVTTTAFPDEAARRKFLQNWTSEFGGVDNAGRIALREVESDDGEGNVGESIDVKVLGISTKDARLVEWRKDLMTEVAIALGVPWSKFDASGRTYDNADAEDRTFYEETVLPDLIDLQDDINMQLAPRLGDEVVWFDLRQVPALHRRVTPITQTVGAPALVQSQLMKINEARADYGLEPVDDGDRFLTAGEIAALRGEMAGDAEGARAPGQGEQRQPEVEPETRQPEPEVRVVDPEAVELRRSTLWRAADAVVTSIEARWVRGLRRLFARQEDAAIARLTGKRGRQALGYTAEGTRAEPAETIEDAGAVFSTEFWVAETVALVEDLYAQAVGAGLDRVALSFGVAFDLEAPWVAETIATRANQLAGQVTQTTYESILAQLIEGVDAGESIDDLATRVRAVFAHANQTRAVTIARTEVISAYNGAGVAGVETLPRDVVIAQEWIATRDGRTRDAHASADGQVQLVGQPFDVAGYAMAYPGDPAGPSAQTVNCRCTVAFLTPDEFEALERMPSVAIEHRVAKRMLTLVPYGDHFDLLGFRRALEATAA